ncbi:TIGR04500 family putative peptide maturation system protein [Planotetraspora sp. A-T 1434]|uniref:TIGR04500 family putative peptide maturation system protein n=1 Tax=Planotetraspora sp. A-T 1434 TaxID=2979219 RepID=UPI0021C0DB8C|nr:TIGR04500 family putative peptide maturation system protein [Planotetraspora sp. A-T 1434]MCT9929249.1 TIGR04500 family putative peptide maturation system protein [Planotetraspora sp. A-T 1434]
MLTQATAVLEEIAELGPEEARERLRGLREAYPDHRFRLVWQREAHDASLHYDLLITRPDRSTLSLSHCPDRGLPWPLRGARAASGNMALLRVNGISMELDRVVAALDFVWDELRLADRLVAACLLEQELQEAPITLSDAELQEAMNAFRRAKGLTTAEATYAWMERHSLSHSALEDMVAGEAAVARLRERVTADKVEAHFARHRADHDTARVVRLGFPDEASARTAASALRHAAGSFYELAERGGVEAAFIEVRRADAPAEVFDARPGTVAGPFGATLFKVIEVRTATLDEATRKAVQKTLFDEWIEERRAASKVEWFWGSASRTARPSP